MAPRPSTPLLNLLRDAARNKGWNTSTLAQHAGISRGRLKQVLAGREPLTVDELIQISNAMELTPADLGVLGAPAAPPASEPSRPPAETSADTPAAPTPINLLSRAPAPSDASSEGSDAPETRPFPDPFGIHAEQILRLGFALGVDIFMLMDTTQLSKSGVPPAVIKRFEPNLPIRLEALYHRHNAPEYFPEGFQVRLSFDALYTCLFPWSAIQHITLYPLAPEPEEEPEAEPEPPSRGGFLRLVE